MSGKSKSRSSGRQSAQNSRAGKDQSRLTSAATIKEDATLYGTGQDDQDSQDEKNPGHPVYPVGQFRFIDLFCGIGGLPSRD